MIIQYLIKKPIIVIGLLLIFIFIYDLQRRGLIKFNRDNLNPTSCRSALVMLQKRMPDWWKVHCEVNNMVLVIDSPHKKLKGLQLKQILYRELANDLIFVSKNCLNESLERTDFITVRVISPSLEVNAITMGNTLAPLAYMKDPKLIVKHIHKTVKIKESIK